MSDSRALQPGEKMFADFPSHLGRYKLPWTGFGKAPRMEALKEILKKRQAGKYLQNWAIPPVTKETEFFNGYHGELDLRIHFADELPSQILRRRNPLDHSGWYTTNDGLGGDTCRGIVVVLPHGRYLWGWSLGEGMCMSLSRTSTDDPYDAVQWADSEAESAAEQMRQDDEAFGKRQDAEDAINEAKEVRTIFHKWKIAFKEELKSAGEKRDMILERIQSLIEDHKALIQKAVKLLEEAEELEGI